jgi:hypothetical protein
MADTLYILTRTSGRPEFFRRCRESVKALQWPGDIVHIVHTDDPRDTYVEGDIIIKGEGYGKNIGSGAPNLYCNRLLEAVPADGWVHFIDDDDVYTEPDVFHRILAGNPDKKKMQICKVARWDDKVYPAAWKIQRSFQTECFVLWSSLAKRGKWWSEKGGDHYYTRQIARKATGMQWHDVLAVKAQEGKGHFGRVDIGGEVVDWDSALPGDAKVWCKVYKNGQGRMAAKIYEMPYAEARTLEKYGFGKVMYKGVTVCGITELRAG